MPNKINNDPNYSSAILFKLNQDNIDKIASVQRYLNINFYQIENPEDLYTLIKKNKKIYIIITQVDEINSFNEDHWVNTVLFLKSHIKIILLLEKLDTDFILIAMNLGVFDIQALPINEEQILDSILKAYSKVLNYKEKLILKKTEIKGILHEQIHNEQKKRRVLEKKLDNQILEVNHLVDRRTKNMTKAIDQLQWEIMERQKAEANLKLAATVFENTSEGILITNSEGTILDVNDAFTAITGYSKSDVIGKNPSILKSYKHDNEFYKNMWDKLLNLGTWKGEIWDRKKTGEVYPKWMTINKVENDRGQITHYVAVFNDITERKEIEQKLSFMAHYDALTKLPNRTLFNDRLQNAINQSKRSKLFIVLMFLDLDGFKYINDTLGHDVGDKLLVEVANRLSNTVRNCDTVSRLGGDEFTIILTNIEKVSYISWVADRILQVFSEDFILSGKKVTVTSSVGISIFPDDANSLDSLIKTSDIAMYHAKKLGKNNYQYYSEELNEQINDRLDIERELRLALSKNQFELHYQPQFDLESNLIVGLEALVRWKRESGTLSYPNEFIAIAEETGIIIQLSEWILFEACKEAKKWESMGFPPLKLSVNISTKQFQQKNFLTYLEMVLDKTQINCNFLELELTESMLIKDVHNAKEILSQIKELGVSVAMDDFGTGYSSLSYLKDFKLDTLKIDKSFLFDFVENESKTIISAIISIARNLHLSIIAEGIETEEHLKFLREAGCQMGQGFYLSKPLDKVELLSLLKQGPYLRKE